LNSFIDTLRSLGPARLGMMAAVAAGIIVFFIYMTSRLTTPDMALLYGDLETQDSGQIVSRLEEAKVPFRIGRDGTQIFVPSDQVARLRVMMAEEGLPSGGSIGYEIFDKSEGLGTTSFVQNINHLRALEGELSRTIRSIAPVKQARVHLVLPRRELFSRERQEPTASIVLVLGGNRQIEKRQVLSIQHLVAAAVPGMKPNAVSVIDDKGTLLARADEGEIEAVALRTEEMRVAFETRLVRTIEEMLERSLGSGNVRAQVAAEMDFDRVTENAEIYDPDGQVVRSTQTIEESNSAQDGQPPSVTVGNNLPDAGLPDLGDQSTSSNNSNRTEETVNYEITRTTKTHIRETGLVRRLSVAVMVNGETTTSLSEEGETTTDYAPRSEEEMEQIAALVRSAVGLDEDRGDTLEVVNMRFTDPLEGLGTSETLVFGFPQKEIMRIVELVVLGVVAILVLLLVVRPLVARLLDGSETVTETSEGVLLPDGTVAHPALAGPAGAVAVGPDGTALATPTGISGGPGSAVDEIESMIDLNQVEGRVRASSIKKIGEIIEKHPEEATAILRTWLYQEA